ncbi:hypothetical protein GF314_17670 [bacterium]|nr:hypothetical protein [bacterium]
MHGFPDIPEFSDDQIKECIGSGDPRPLLFELYKLVAEVALNVASISPDSPAYRNPPALHAAIVSGLANRCARLMVSVGKLSCGGYGGESASILTRCVVETAIVLRWLTESTDQGDVFRRYIVDGLRPDLKLEEHIEQCIADRDGEKTVIEQRMLRSIERSRRDAGMDRATVESSKGMPDLKTIMIDRLDYENEGYIGVQRMLSQFVHGRWSDLRSHYIERDGSGAFRLKDVDEAPIHANLLLLGVVLVTDAARSVFSFFLQGDDLRAEFDEYCATIRARAYAADAIRSHRDNDLVDDDDGNRA